MFENQQRAWVRQPSGCRLDLINPDPNSWEDEDLAIGLSRTYRWGGHSICGRPMSVAQHSILVLVLRKRLTGKLSRVESLRELLHDAEEGLIGFDPNLTPEASFGRCICPTPGTSDCSSI